MNTDKQIPNNIFSQLVQKFGKKHPGYNNIKTELEETASTLDGVYSDLSTESHDPIEALKTIVIDNDCTFDTVTRSYINKILKKDQFIFFVTYYSDIMLRVLMYLIELIKEREPVLEEKMNFNPDDNPYNSIYELFNLDYLYHATYVPYLKEIKKVGYIKPGKHKNWDISNESHIYLSKDIDAAAAFAESSPDVPEEYLDQIVVLKIDPKYLNIDKLDIDHNQIYDYDSSVDVEDPTTWVDFEYDGEIPVKAIVEIINY